MKNALVKPTILDLPSEGILAWEKPGFPQTDYVAYHLKGPCDPEAMAQAVRLAQQGRPHFHANLVPDRPGLLLTLQTWRICEAPAKLEVHDHTGFKRLPENMEEWIHGEMAPKVADVQDLTKEYPVGFFLFLLPDDNCFFAMLFHHVVADGGEVYEFVKDTFCQYHRIVTGSGPEWVNVAGMHAQAGQIKPVKPITNWEALKFTFREGRKYPIRQAVQTISDTGGQSGRKMIRYCFKDLQLQQALRDRARKAGGTLTDLAMAGAKLALQEWNTTRGADSEIMFHGLAVNQRLRRPLSETKEQGNPMSGIFIPSNSEDRKDPEALLQYVIKPRKMKMDQGHDVAMTNLLHPIMRASRILPLSIRYRFLRLNHRPEDILFHYQRRNPLARIVDGRPTGETAVDRVGQMEIFDIHVCVGATENNGSALILRTFARNLYMTFVIGRHKLADDDAHAYSKLIVDKILGYL